MNGDDVMRIDETIRKYRKEQNLTQEQMAYHLGVSAPAVNKWENGISYPDIELLAPLARLLKIDIDTLLSFRDELSEQEIGQFINQLSEEITSIGFEESFKSVVEKIREFPNCNKLILWSAQLLNAHLIMKIKYKDEKEKYMNQIIAWFEKVAFCDDSELAKVAQISLAQNLMNNERYTDAQKILDKIPSVGFDKRATQVQLFVEQEKYEEAFKIQDEMLYQQASELISTMMHTIAILCKQKEFENAIYYADVINIISNTVHLGSYIANSSYFTIYAEMKNPDKTLDYLEKMLNEFETMRVAKDSKLYSHMKFKENDGLKRMKEMILNSINTCQEMDFIRSEPRYTPLLEKFIMKKDDN